ncbi:uncharacterized protein LOC134692897 [Mytilus trossulus]|uniref:uncharacterized protein LOC134692897 n=1 Tax=Mytilus trossulus TaxID=6551 RepID=UPI0030064106
MASNPKFCGICDQRHITKSSSDWCSECNQSLCIECKDFHTLSKASQNHSTIAISNYLALESSFSKVEGHCSVHDDKYVLFCQTHDCLLCLTCLEEHTKCEDVVRISKITKDVKTSESLLDTQKSLSDIILNLSKIQCDLEENICDIKKQKDSILLEISQMREKINSHLDKIEHALKTELCKEVDNQCNNTMYKTLEDIKRKKIDIEKCQQQMSDLDRYGSDLQMYFGLREITARTNTYDLYIQTLDDDGSLNRVTISCKIDSEISKFVKKVASLGTIQVQKVPSQLILKRSKDKQAQLVDVRNKSINDIKLKLVHTFTLMGSITGCCFLPDGKIVLCDRSLKNLVQILNQHGVLIFEVSMSPSYTFDVTCIDDKTVAVSSDSPNQKQIDIIDVKTRARRSIPTADKCYGITHKDGSLMVCVAGKGVQNVNTQNGKSISLIPCDIGRWSYIVTSDNKLYYTNSKKHTVTCCDKGGNIIWTFKDENVFRDPRGIDVDNSGNIYILSNTCNSQNKLIVISADGQHSRSLLSKDDGLVNPYAVAYDKIQNRICVVNFNDKGFLFDLTI